MLGELFLRLDVMCLLFLAAAIFVVATYTAWPANRMLWHDLVGRFRSLPSGRRPSAPTPELPEGYIDAAADEGRSITLLPRSPAVSNYEATFFVLSFAVSGRDVVDRQLAVCTGNGFYRRQLERQRNQWLNGYAAARDRAAACLAGLSDADIAAIADVLSRDPTYDGGFLQPEECVTFLREERSLAASHPFTVVDHAHRRQDVLGRLVRERRTAAAASGVDKSAGKA